MTQVFSWCGSASLEKQLKPVTDFTSMAAGDVLIRGGFPGHAVIIADIAMNKMGKKYSCWCRDISRHRICT